MSLKRVSISIMCGNRVSCRVNVHSTSINKQQPYLLYKIYNTLTIFVYIYTLSRVFVS